MNFNICPFCFQRNYSKSKICKNCNKPLYVQPQTEWKGQIEQVSKGYKTGNAKGIAHGLQKDAIQNSWGACRNKNEWSTAFELIYAKNNRDNVYLTITDTGTFGLCGKIYDNPEDIPNELSENERLARFENMNFSGGNSGPGLYGRGKLIFQASSFNKSIIYDSLLENGEYRLGQRVLDGRRLKQTSRVLQNEFAKQTLKNLTKNRLNPLTKIGTRITIINPIEEIVVSMDNGSFLKYIEETWWEILHNYNVQISVITDGAKKTATCPSLLKDMLSQKTQNKNYYKNSNITTSVMGEPYKIKRICFLKVEKTIDNHLQGLFVQRKGMKIGNVELRFIPEELKGKIIGYIQLDKKYENKIEEAENLEHYGFSLQYASYRELKNKAQQHFDRFKAQLGYEVEKGQSEDEKAKKALEISENKLNEILKSLGLTGIGLNQKSKDIVITFKKAIFPTDIKKVKINDIVKNIEFNIRNKSTLGKRLRILVETKTKKGKLLERLLSKRMDLIAGQSKKIGPLSIVINEEIYPNKEEIYCYCYAEESGKIIARSKFSIFIGLKPPQIINPVAISLKSFTLPNPGSKRVNFDQKIKNVSYLIKNELDKNLRIRFSVRTEINEDNHIEEMFKKDLTLKNFSEQIVDIPNIVFSKNKYSAIEPGMLQIRSRAISSKKQFDIKKGKKLAKQILQVWLNSDEPGFGIFEKIEEFNGGSNQPRAVVRQESTGKWIFRFNRTHPNYEAIKDELELINSYTFELMARETLYIALYSGQFDAFRQQIKYGDQPHEVSRTYNLTLDKILTKYYS